MPELAMAASDSHYIPSVILQQVDYVADFHPLSLAVLHIQA